MPKAGEPGSETWIHDPKLPVGGGAVWTPMSLDTDRGELYVPVTNPSPDYPTQQRLIPGVDYMGGTVDMDTESHELLTAIDVSSGGIRWQYRSPKPMVAAVTTTAGGLVFAGENGGDLPAFDAEKGTVLYRFNTGGALAGGIVTYAVGGKQYVGVASGKGSFFYGNVPGAPTIVVFTLPAT